MALQDTSDPSLYRLLDACNTPDPYYSDDYNSQYRGKGTVIVIDNGSYQCRAGWAGETSPRIIFRSVIAKARGKRGEPDTTVIGNDIKNIEAVRTSLKSPFDHNIVTNFSQQELMLDHCFSHLGLASENRVSHPVLLTEPLCNPSYCRSQMSELLFEAYGIPAVAYGVDSLFSAYNNLNRVSDSLIISAGHQTVHILPVRDGHPDFPHCKRVNIGGLNTVGYLHRLLQLRYPSLQSHITLTRAQEILSHHCAVALDYPDTLRAWAAGKCDDMYRTIQLPYSQLPPTAAVDSLAKEQKDQARRQRGREQLLRVNQRKKEEKIAASQSELTTLTQLLESQVSYDPEEFQCMLEDGGFNSIEELSSSVKTLRASLAAEQEKLAGIVDSLASGPKVAEETEVSEEWLDSLRERKMELLEQRKARAKRKQELGKRRSAASQKRMRIISLLGAEENIKKKSKQSNEDTFGMDDNDWNVYRTISKDADESTDEREETELMEIGKVLEKHDHSKKGIKGTPQGGPRDMASCYQVMLGVERLRAPEIMFQPSIVGVDQSGLSDCMEYVLQYYPPDIQQKLVQNVFLTGGSSQFPGFQSRVEADLKCFRPFQSHFNVCSADDKILDAWRGGATWSCDAQSRERFVLKQEYLENGAEYFKEHSCSNINTMTN